MAGSADTGPAGAGPPRGPAAEAAGDDGEVTVADDICAGPDEPAARRASRSWLTELVVLVVVALVIALTVKTYLVQPFWIPSQSMENTLLVNDRVLVNKLVGHISQIHRGDIVVFDGAGSWKPPAAADDDPLTRIYRDFLGLFGHESDQTDYIKRVIGVPGDHVRCCNARGLLTVNGVPLHEGGYLYPGSAPSAIRFSIVVPPGRLWVMGDNRGDSADSRYHDCQISVAACEPWDRDGTIPESAVIGRAFVVIWPASRFRMLWVPATFSQPALAAGAPGQAAGSAMARPAAAAALTTGQLRAIPADPALPLMAGGIVAAPLTLLERRWRRRARARRRAAA
jgi:signal peptidase I